MSKSTESMMEVLRDPRNVLRGIEQRPDKSHKNRYARRKLREFLRAGDWESLDE
jgi:hypothetical protein